MSEKRKKLHVEKWNFPRLVPLKPLTNREKESIYLMQLFYKLTIDGWIPHSLRRFLSAKEMDAVVYKIQNGIKTFGLFEAKYRSKQPVEPSKVSEFISKIRYWSAARRITHVGEEIEYRCFFVTNLVPSNRVLRLLAKNNIVLIMMEPLIAEKGNWNEDKVSSLIKTCNRRYW